MKGGRLPEHECVVCGARFDLKAGQEVDERDRVCDQCLSQMWFRGVQDFCEDHLADARLHLDRQPEEDELRRAGMHPQLRERARLETKTRILGTTDFAKRIERTFENIAEEPELTALLARRRR